ncbi:MAG: hypothetical protein ACI8Z1_003344 [Candidatus Azotimanducaceae bacterium]|jgi:uncharacterized protein YggU (UPF0235/DUF167 family)
MSTSLLALANAFQRAGRVPNLVMLKVKIVPGAAETAFAGWLLDALKIRIAAPAEKGKANTAVIAVLHRTLGLPKHSITIHSRHQSARKLINLEGITEKELNARLSSASDTLKRVS